MSRFISIALIVVIAGGLLLVVSSMFVVNQYSQALVLRFGETVGVENAWTAEEEDPGLKFKAPFIDRAVIFSRKLLELDMPELEVIANDQERLVVDAFARYRITDPLLFYQAVQNVDRAELQLQEYMEASLRRVLGSVESGDIISGQRADLMEQIRADMNDQATEDSLGVAITDVKIRQADLPQQNAERVYTRMQTEREQRAAEIRAEGEQRSREIRAEADKTRTVILAEAREQAEVIKGEGDAQRNAIYADAYNRDPEFFAFYRSLQAYEKSIEEGTQLVLSPQSDFFRYFGDQGGRQ
ncbi:protease modulator HflC [Euryhalocaulis caribicus]|uniref:protease modulator HflC n=1 Tax=Euryhalocaulis caribicus TaxID=1161401 RepID=UPI00039F47C6|nr:protease modulator HflC [Euryhalocaulis caribicus]